jgi:hypothetical protein
LQAVALGEQRTVLGRQLVHEGVETRPECGAVDSGAGQGFGFDELVEIGGDLQSAARVHLSHRLLHLSEWGR